jgi:choline transport protein
MIQALAIYNYPSYVPQRWQTTLIMIGFAVFATLINTLGKKQLPLWETAGGVFHVCVQPQNRDSDDETNQQSRLFFFIIMIAVLATGEKASNTDVWGTFINGGGWSSDGISFCLGFLTPAFALAGVEAVVHMAEEAYDANVNVPRGMIWSVVINGLAGFAYILTILYSITNVETVLNTPTGFPIIAVFQEATGNPKAATAMLCAVIVVFSFCLMGIVASVSRLTWAFARDHGIPFSGFFSHITPWNKCPTRTVVLTSIITSLLSLINIGSTAAFNAFLSLATIALYFSYAIPIVLFAIRRFSKTNPIQFGPWSMGRLGLVINILAVAFCLFLIIFLPFPPVLPVTSVNMNYAAPIFIGVMLIAIADYAIRGHRKFTGPIKEVASESSSEVGHAAEAIEEKYQG